MTVLTATVRRWAGLVLEYVLIIGAVFAVQTAIAEPFYVPSGSMEPTLLIGDELLATKYPYGYSAASLPPLVTLPRSERLFGSLPARGDVVVFRWPGDRSQVWVKRVIGLPGDRVALRDGVVVINGTAAQLHRAASGNAQDRDGPATRAARLIETLPGGRQHAIFKLTARQPLDDMDEVTVPPDHVFVMGDNRDNSADSRVPLAEGGVGMLPVNDLVGRVDGIVGSWDLAMKSQPLWTWPQGLRLSRFFSAVN